MLLIDRPVREFLEALQARTPTPGGGSVAALSGALGASLLAMVLRYSVGKKTSDADRQVLEGALADASKAALELAQQVDQDALAYDAAFQASRAAREHGDRRDLAERAQEANEHAARVPLTTALLSARVLASIEPLREKLNRNLASDALVAAHSLRTAVHGAVLNVRVNLPSLTRPEVRDALSRDAEEVLARAEGAVVRLLDVLRIG